MNNEKVKFLLNWNHFSDHLSSCMTKLMTDVSYSDIIIATADKHMIYSHRFVLANSSKYFQRVLKNMKRQREIQLVVALPEIKYEIFKILMNYMYKGETQVPHELLPSVIKAGQFLEINGLVNLSENDSSGGGSGTGNNASIVKYSSSTSDQHPPRCSIIHSSNFSSSSSSHGSSSQESQKKPRECGVASSTLRDKIHSRENATNCTKTVFRAEKRGRLEKHSSESQSPGENGKENRGKLAKSSKTKTSSQDNVDFIQLPLKRKSLLRDSMKKTSSVSSPTASMSADSVPPKKSQKRFAGTQEVIPLSVKSEKEVDESPVLENKSDDIDLDDKITIKEEPDDIEEVEYNELQCEFCHEVYTNPSEWVKHMTEQHEDRGYQTYKDLDKSGGGNAVITCVVCSCVCFSAAEWANHLRMWHTDRELAVANMTDQKKSTPKVKKKSAASKKQ